jgi:lysyl-tRNA synthetase class 2
MSHVQHIATHKNILERRALLIRGIREFFWQQDFLDVETPLLLARPGQEPYLSPMKVLFHNEKAEEFTGYLHTSPEYALKKMLGAGFTNVFSITKTFRDYESFGGTHNPEFTMIEWYRANNSFESLMDDCEGLWKYLAKSISDAEKANMPWERLHMNEAWERYAGASLHDHLNREAMAALCVKKGYPVTDKDSYDDLFFKIFLNEIEPKLGERGATILHHYPLSMAALARVSPTDARYAERFEVYIHGIEIANAFGELTDAEEQQRRLEEEQAFRKTTGKEVFPIDTEFIEALRTMPPSAGIALGVDRLIQALLGAKDINSVLALPASLLF